VAEVKILWSTRSLKDIEEIVDYISKDSPAAARNFATKTEAVMVLETFPTIGRIVLEYHNPNIREVLYRNYRIVYELSGNAANIVTVFHGSRMLE